MTAKEIIKEHFKISSLIYEEALQSALITAQFLNDKKIIEEINVLIDIENNRHSYSDFTKKYMSRKSVEQMQLFETKINEQ
jgi:hypothetical protein